MNKQEDHIDNSEQMVRYLDGLMDNHEVDLFEQKLRSDAEFAKEFQEYKYLWNASAFPWQDVTLLKSDKESDWKKVMEKSGAPDVSKVQEMDRVARVIGQHGFVNRKYVQLVRMAAILLFTVLTSVMLTYVMFNPVDEDIQEVVFREITTDRSQRASVQLSDGTKVNLSVDSRIKMPDVFARDVREVELTGEAYFDVAHSPDRPFIIRSGNTIIQVLGTDFGVRAYPDEDQIKVVVKSGSVAVTSNGGQEQNSIVLKPGQLARVSSNTNTIDMEWVDPDDYLGWIEGKLSFNQSTLKEVINQLERWYDLEVVLEDKKILDRRLTAVIDSRSLANVMNVIALSVDLSYEVIDNKIFIRDNQK